MANDASPLPPLTPEQRRLAAAQFDRANQAVAAGFFDGGIALLLTCCRVDPANLIYRQRLRQAQKAKYRHNLRGRRFAFLTSLPGKVRLKAALKAHDYLGVLALGEEVLVQNPWDTQVQLHMAAAARQLHLLDLALWILEQARQRDPQDRSVNRTLAQLYEQCGHFRQAQDLWTLVAQVDPHDREAGQKARRLTDAQEPGREPPAPPNLEAEVQSLNDRLTQDPTRAESYVQLARLYRQAGRLDEAQTVLQRGLGAAGRHFEITAELVELEIEPFRQNLAIVEERLIAQPADAELREIRDHLLKEINTRELDLYRLKADRYPREKQYRLELGLRLLRAGRVDEAMAEMEEANRAAGARQHFRGP